MSVLKGARLKLQRTGNEAVDRNLQTLFAAVEDLDAAIQPVPVLVSFVVSGSNGIGSIKLTPPKTPDSRILRRATPGAKMVAAVNLTDLTDVQLSFEQATTSADYIKQLDSANLSAKKILIILANFQ